MTTELTEDELRRLKEAYPPRVYEGKYAAKLSPDDKRAAFALLRWGYSQRVVAAVFNLHRQTVATMSRDGSSSYRDVRNEYAEIGHDRFMAKHLKEHHLQKAREYATERASSLEERIAVGKKANKKEGTHVHKKVEFSVVWIDAESCWGVIEPGDPEPILPSGYDGSTSSSLYAGLIACIDENGAIYAL